MNASNPLEGSLCLKVKLQGGFSFRLEDTLICEPCSNRGILRRRACSKPWDEKWRRGRKAKLYTEVHERILEEATSRESARNALGTMDINRATSKDIEKRKRMTPSVKRSKAKENTPSLLRITMNHLTSSAKKIYTGRGKENVSIHQTKPHVVTINRLIYSSF